MTIWQAVSTFWMEAGVTSIPPVLGAGGTAPGDILVAHVYGDDPNGFTPPSADWVRLSGPDQSGALYGELWQLVITADMGTDGDMSGETLTWSQGVTGSLGVNVMALHASDTSPCRVLVHAVRTATTTETAHPAPTITTTEASIPLIFGAHGLGEPLAVPAGWVGINHGDDNTRLGGVASVKSEGLAATVDYAPGDFTSTTATEAITYTVAVVDTVEEEEPPPDGLDPPPVPEFTTTAPMAPPTDVGIQDGVTLTEQAYFSVGAEEVGAVFEGLDCTEGTDNYGTLTIYKNCNFRGAASSGHVFNRPGASAILINCSFDCTQTPQAIIGNNVIAYNCDIYGMAADGIKVGSDSWYLHCYIHDAQPGQDAHGDGMQAQDVVSGLTVISDCYVDMVLPNQEVDGHYSSACLHDSPNNPAPDGRAPGTLVVVGNYFRGGGYIANIGGDSTNVETLHASIIHDNVIEAGSYEYTWTTPFNVATDWPGADSLFSYWRNQFDDGTPVETESTVHREVSQEANQFVATTLAGGTGTELLGVLPAALVKALAFIITEYPTVSDTSGPFEITTATMLDPEPLALSDSIVVELHTRGDVAPISEQVGILDQVIVTLTRIGDGRVTQVTHQAVDPSKEPAEGREVAAILRSGGGPFIGAAEIVDPIVRRTDADGRVVLPLIPNPAISPGGSWYEVRVEGGQTWRIEVPVSDVPVTLRSCVVPA